MSMIPNPNPGESRVDYVARCMAIKPSPVGDLAQDHRRANCEEAWDSQPQGQVGPDQPALDLLDEVEAPAVDADGT